MYFTRWLISLWKNDFASDVSKMGIGGLLALLTIGPFVLTILWPLVLIVIGLHVLALCIDVPVLIFTKSAKRRAVAKSFAADRRRKIEADAANGKNAEHAQKLQRERDEHEFQASLRRQRILLDELRKRLDMLPEGEERDILQATINETLRRCVEIDSGQA